VIADTSVWVDHLRRGNRKLAARLEDGVIYCHEFVIGELACGTLRQRGTILALLDALPRAARADHDEVLTLVETRRLAGSGIGWIDVHLLASALLTHVSLWTLDRRLAAAAERVGVAAGM